MVSIISGRKLFTINKNMESGLGISHSPIAEKSRFSPDLPILPSHYDQSFKNFNLLKQCVNEKEKKIQDLQQKLVKSSESININPIYNNIIPNSIYRSKQCVELYKNHYKELQNQILEKERKKIEKAKEKQQELKESVQRMNTFLNLEYNDRRLHLEKTEDYRRNLEVQRSLNLSSLKEEKKSKNVTPKVNERLRKNEISIRYHNDIEDLPRISKENSNKVYYGVGIDYSLVPGSSQPKYSMKNPKNFHITPEFSNRH